MFVIIEFRFKPWLSLRIIIFAKLIQIENAKYETLMIPNTIFGF